MSRILNRVVQSSVDSTKPVVDAENRLSFMSPIHIDRAKPEDATVLTEIAFAAKRHWGYPELWIESWREILTISPSFIVTNRVYAARIEGRIVGFYALECVDGQSHLEHLWVQPAAMGQGVGRSLFQHAAGSVRGLGFSQLHIEADPNASGFYARMGAQQIGSRISFVNQVHRELPIFIYQADAPAPAS